MKFKIFFCFIFTMLTTLMFSACVDDLIYTQYGDIPDGEGDVNMQITFEAPYSVKLGSRTPGDEVEDINSLCVLIYDENGMLYRKVPRSQMVNYQKTQPQSQTSPDDALTGNNAHQDQPQTVRVDFTVKNIPFGRYHIYAVANMNDLDGYDVSTVDKLKSIRVKWNAANIGANNQMFGYFTQSNESSSKGFNAPQLIIRESGTTIHSWIKRTVSKVTIAYDGSGLNKNVLVFIHNVTIYDIPDSCYIGKDNAPNKDSQLINRYATNASDPLPNTRFIYNRAEEIISPSEDTPADANPRDVFQRWMMVARASGKNEDGRCGSDHSATAEALYFFENMQGDKTGMGVKYDKRQQSNGKTDGVGHNITSPEVDENGKLVYEDGLPVNDYKDRQLYGTYIEVDAYYMSMSDDNPSEGPIKYRFMLGKDTKFDYNAARNYHYKLTLGFKGWANQPDWHIEYYEQDPGIEVGPTFNISYLYNQKAMLPIKLSGNCKKLTLKIIENNWAPFDRDKNSVPPAGGTTTKAGDYSFKWAKTVYEAGNTGTDKPYLGFLALRVPGDTEADIPVNIVDNMTFSAGVTAQNALKTYYETNEQNIREFKETDLTLGKHIDPTAQNNNWEVTELPDESVINGKNQCILHVPLWTRNKSMITASGFSGNNPYEYFYRKAVVKIYGEFEEGGQIVPRESECIVYQVPRIVNPKGVWRSYKKNGTFRVELKEPMGSDACSDFYNIQSFGTWKAYIEAPADVKFVSLEKSEGTMGELKDGVIYGETGSEIDFNIRFNGVSETESKCAIIRVDYHAENCIHKILVRQGYSEPIHLGGKDWSSFMLYANRSRGGTDGSSDWYTSELTKNPLVMGSLFRRGKQSRAILSSNDDLSNRGAMEAPNGASFRVRRYYSGAYHIDNAMWNEIGCRDDNSNTWNDSIKTLYEQYGITKGNRTYTLGTFFTDYNTAKQRKYRCPTVEDFQALSKQCQFGFGIVYGDGAIGTDDDFATATGLQDGNNTGDESAMGSRGVIAYDPSTGDQVFFPVGKTGMGRRKGNLGGKLIKKGETPDKDEIQYYFLPNLTYLGTLWYSDVFDVLAESSSANNKFRPIPYNLPIAPGAVYWIDKRHASAHIEGTTKYACLGWDINYFNFDFDAYTTNNFMDACPIKLVIDK